MPLAASAAPLKRPVKVGELVRRRLRELGRTQGELAEALDLPETYVADLVAGRRRPPAVAQGELYDEMTRFLRLHRNDLLLCAKAELGDEAAVRRRAGRRVRELLFALCEPTRARVIARRIARPGGAELECLIVDRLLAVAKGFARRQLEDEFGVRVAARRAGLRSAERRMQLLDFLDTTPTTVTPADIVAFVQPRLAAWDIDLETRAMRIVLRSGDPTPGRRFA
jgi:transcriptional regulator with XRE-family HTH domain